MARSKSLDALVWKFERHHPSDINVLIENEMGIKPGSLIKFTDYCAGAKTLETSFTIISARTLAVVVDIFKKKSHGSVLLEASILVVGELNLIFVSLTANYDIIEVVLT